MICEKMNFLISMRITHFLYADTIIRQFLLNYFFRARYLQNNPKRFPKRFCIAEVVWAVGIWIKWDFFGIKWD
jgi:hypothetical protein